MADAPVSIPYVLNGQSVHGAGLDPDLNLPDGQTSQVPHGCCSHDFPDPHGTHCCCATLTL
eukprot:2586994-Rhodomonas_salina.4